MGRHHGAMNTAGTPEELVTTVDRLFEEHQHAVLPRRFREETPAAGVDLVLLDAHLAGCVSTWLHGGGRLDAAHRPVVRDCLRDLDQLLPRLTYGHERRYVERLRELARLLVQAGG